MSKRSFLAVFDSARPTDSFADAMLAVSDTLAARMTFGLLAPAPVPGERTFPEHLSREQFNELVEAKEQKLWTIARARECDVRIFIDTVDAALDAVTRASRCFDLVCIGPADSYVDRDLRAMLIEALLIHSGKPLLLLPDHGPTGVFRQLVVGWDGMSQVVRALDCSLQLCRSDARVDLVSILPLDSPLALRTSADDMTARLSELGMSAFSSLVQRQRQSIAAALLAKAAAEAADLVVLGGYGHARLEETLFGGTTREIIHGAHNVPILIAH